MLLHLQEYLSQWTADPRRQDEGQAKIIIVLLISGRS